MHVSDHHLNLRLAIDEAHKAAAAGNTAVGSVIVREGLVVGAGHNTVRSDGDLIAHAEVSAIRDACGRLNTRVLAGATLYTTMEPCPMCLWAICIAGIGRLVIGARHSAFHRPELGSYSLESMLAMTAVPVELVTGILVAECEALCPEMARVGA